MAVLSRHLWPGNVRELENAVYRSAVVAQGDAILVKDLPPEIRGAAGEALPGAALTVEAALDFLIEHVRAPDQPLLAQIDTEVARRVLKAAGGDEAAAAKRLGITRAALRKKL
jgi:two-component system nitrogen regulation response regulator GlnG